jgi:hypothetical protein
VFPLVAITYTYTKYQDCCQLFEAPVAGTQANPGAGFMLSKSSIKGISFFLTGRKYQFCRWVTEGTAAVPLISGPEFLKVQTFPTEIHLRTN